MSSDKDDTDESGDLLFLKTLGLEEYYPNKLTLTSLLEINKASVSDKEIYSLQEMPWAFLRKLLMADSSARSLQCAAEEKNKTDDMFAEQDCDDNPNLLDLTTALFICADSFLQQKMAVKMSMCQFAVPFLLPHGINNQCTLMLWALRGILKEWRPHSVSESKGFVEGSDFNAKIPLISFVRLSKCSISKSQVLNQVLNNSQQHHNFFSHREMVGGASPRIISDGLVEVCWSLSSGNNSIDVFHEPVVIGNLRGDVCTFETQFSFLTQVSTAVFVFLDSVEEIEQRLFASLQGIKSKLFLVVNPQRNMNQNVKSSIEAAIDTLQLQRDHIIMKSQKVNLENFSSMIISAVKKLLAKDTHTTCEINSMKRIAQELGLGTDENIHRACGLAEEKAEKIMKRIGVRSIMEYKKSQLLLQGENWKRLAQIEKEQCRLEHSGELSLEEYKVQLQKEKDEILKKQSQYKITETMDILINTLSVSDDTERSFFLKWLEIKLDMRSRKQMSDLRHKYTQCEQKKDREGIARLDQELVDSSLGIEHYMREIGQIYEAASFGSNKISDKILNLPTLAAQMLLAGFPFELLDGNASNIPEKWVSDVLMELHRMVGQKSRLLVVTVLGVQSTGKSTLLNTMFGVQFAVGSGRCTRGAFMIFLPVGKDFKEELHCDFVLLINTEGLKSPPLAQLEDSYQHDNELAMFVIGLSDVTIINVAMEHSKEMKDILQIAVYTFLQIKKIGKKTVCHFVHQNVAGVSAYDKNMADRLKLLGQLNEMTLIAAEMNKQPHLKKITDVLDYDVKKNNWYIPGLWHGTPPMAPVNTGYSVAVLDFKKKLLETLTIREHEELSQIPEFLQRMSSLWRTVKFENFMFSFRNNLVTHVYVNLCKEFSEWEWSYKRHMVSLLLTAEVQISNAESSCSEEVFDALQNTLHTEIASQTKAIAEKLKDYYKRKDHNVHLVEKYKAGFTNSIKSLEIEMKHEVSKRLCSALGKKRNKEKFQNSIDFNSDIKIKSLLSDNLLSFLKTLGLEKYYPNKLTLRTLLEINRASVSDEVHSLQAMPWVFLQKLLMTDSNSRSLQCAAEENNKADDLFAEQDCDGTINLLDLTTALFICADSFLQQEIAVKMSMCHFAVPFLLPQGIQNQCTLMVWALRGILKEWRPHSMSETKGFVEDSVVNAKIPLISFVKLSNCSLSKSQVLNQVLNKSQQHHDFFLHQEMIGGSASRIISDGLVEICWNLPSGNNSTDVFPEPVAIANLRGDVCIFKTQFSFLAQISTAVFVFLDSIEEMEQRLFASLQEITSKKIFLVVNAQKNMKQNVKSSIETAIDSLQVQRDHIIYKSQKVNLANFSIMIRSVIKSLLAEDTHMTYEINSMKTIAQELGLGTDENKNKACEKAEETAEGIMKHIGACPPGEYKKSQLLLQGENWKRLAQIEKEQCRLKHSGELSLEEYKVQLQKEKDEIMKKKSQYKMTETMDILINALSISDDTERAFFLKWLAIKLDMRSRKQMSDLRHNYTLCEQKKDRDAIMLLDQKLVDCSLGIEHYMREIGQIYEAASFGANKMSDKILNLPTLAAQMLLSGFPLELLDGDASNIPEKWVNDVLMELHRMVGQKSRLLVVTVLGVQSTGKSTLLNTMFGVQFAVGSGRCTRGAFMIFLPVGKDLKEELLCDFVLLIDTEGLKSPALAQLSDSYEHDNELATFVIGLSDVTIINVAMENSTEMKDVLQIAVHAFLRMKEIGKKTVCHFVHQNVAGVSAYDKNMADRQKLLDQLNEMTLIAAEMEKQPYVKKFTDVLDYDVKKNNWYIPGLWHGTPPMAPVNTGYSVAVLDFKKNLLETLTTRKDEQHFQIPEFLQWLSSLWSAVKFENFIFSFRNTLVAQAYENLCKEFSKWEWSFRRHMLSLLLTTEVQISNAESSCIQKVVDEVQNYSHKEIAIQRQLITEKLKDYYKRNDCNVNLVEKYKAGFTNSIKSLEIEMKHEVSKRLCSALGKKRNKEKVEEIQNKQAALMECQVQQLILYYKDHNDELCDDDLKDAFEKMWRTEVANVAGLRERNVPNSVLKQLRASFGNRPIMEDLQSVKNLTQYGHGYFIVNNKTHVKFSHKFKCLFSQNSAKQDLEIVAVDVITSCTRMINQFIQSEGDYQETFIKDVLDEIDAHLKKAGSKINIKFEFDLKLHICGIASQKFLEMHRRYLAEQDPLKHLQKFKSQYLSDFIDLYRERDQCQRKAQDFTQLCLKPAVTEYINKSLGPDIVDAVLENKTTEYSTRTLFQYTILKELLEKSTFNDFAEYILHYENYVKDWIYNHIIEHFSTDKSLQKLKMKKLDSVIEKITKAVEASKLEPDGSLLPNNAKATQIFIQNLCKAMSHVISISVSTVERVLFQNKSCCDPFTKSLHESIDDLKQQIQREISESTDATETLKNVSVKPQDELFKRVFGCGVQCPFCKTPCEAGGKEHQLHHATVHRPQGLGMCSDVESNILCEEICTSSVHGNGTFENHKTNFQPYPYRDYQKYYPDWHIAPDMSIEASDYWKYVLVTFNKQFAERYEALAAIYPGAWNKITKDQAFVSLKHIFNIK